MLLVLTSELDLTVDFLITRLIEKNLPYFRVNSEEFLKAAPKFLLDEDGVSRLMCLGPKKLDLETVKAVWYRRVVQPLPVRSLTTNERAFVAGELRHFAEGLFLDPDVIWVNPIEKVSTAEHKLYQLRVATRLGLKVPRTLVSHDRAELKAFIDRNNIGTICKPIYHGLYVDGNDRYSIYTRLVTAEQLEEGDTDSCPVLLQELIPRSGDVRVTIIGSECFVADIRSDEHTVDWRSPENSAQYSIGEIDSRTRSACKRMLDDLGLKYGAFDFVRTPDGELVFLEVNPTGEWAWLEDRLGFPMRDAFINLLYGTRS